MNVLTDHLTQREVDVLRLVCRGFRNAEIAQILKIKFYTVIQHVQSIYRKIDVNTRAEAAVWATRQGLLDMPNVRGKGAKGEREVVHLLNSIILRLLASQEWPEDHRRAAGLCIQRNLNQSARGGDDLTGVFGLSVEVKRQETLHINTWWAQCQASAKRNNEHPVLLYRTNNNPWNCITLASAPLPGHRHSALMRMQMEQDSFENWFYCWVYYKMVAGDLPRV